jgi:hypothetical protein
MSLAGCGSSGGGPAPTPTPVAKTFSPTGTLTMTSSVDSTGINYTASIQLSEHGGLGASIGNVDITYKVNGATLGTVSFDGAQAWVGGTRLNAMNNLGSNFLILVDSAGTVIPDSADALVHYTDDGQKTGSLTLTASIPAPPGPPSNARFTVTGTVVESPGNFPIRDATVAVTTGATSGASTRTDGNGRYTLSGVAAGAVTIRASKQEYDGVDQTINLRADQQLDFTLKKSGKLLPTATPAAPSWTPRWEPQRLQSIVK